MSSERKNLILISTFYMLFFMAGGVISQYLPLFYSNVGFNYKAIGTILSIGSIASVIAQPFAASFSDKSNNKINIFRIIMISTFTSIWFVFFSGNRYILMLIAASIFYGFSGCLQPLNDSIVIEMSKYKNYKYQTIRLLGSLGFAIMTAFTGIIVAKKIEYIFPMYAGIILSAFVISYFVPTVKTKKSHLSTAKFTELFKDKKFVFFLVYAFLLSITNAFFNSFQGIYSKEKGISLALIGIGSMIGSFSQFPAMAFFLKLNRKFGMKNLMLTAGIAYALRWLLYATVLSSKTVLFLWATHGLTYILLFLCLVEYTRENIADELSTRALVLINLILFGISGITGSALGGLLSTAYGIKNVFFMCSIICIISALLFYWFYPVKSEKQESIINGNLK